MQFQFRQQSYLFRFKIGFFILCLFFVFLFSMLGVWQLHRYHYKKMLVSTFQDRLTAAPKPFLQVTGSGDLQFQRITVEGHYLNALTMLVQNKFNQGRSGFEVLTPLQIRGQEKLLLIDRGWIQKPANQNLPSIDHVNDKQQIIGYIKLLDERQFTLGKNILNPAGPQIVMQKIDLDELSQITHQSFYPFILRLDASEPNGFVRDWVISIVPPERHMGYAIQWFVLVIVVLIGYLAFCSEKKNANKK